MTEIGVGKCYLLKAVHGKDYVYVILSLQNIDRDSIIFVPEEPFHYRKLKQPAARVNTAPCETHALTSASVAPLICPQTGG